jgi:hypothetical protein
MTGRISMGDVVFSGRVRTPWGTAQVCVLGGSLRDAGSRRPGSAFGSIANLSVLFA